MRETTSVQDNRVPHSPLIETASTANKVFVNEISNKAKDARVSPGPGGISIPSGKKPFILMKATAIPKKIPNRIEIVASPKIILVTSILEHPFTRKSAKMPFFRSTRFVSELNSVSEIKSIVRPMI